MFGARESDGVMPLFKTTGVREVLHAYRRTRERT